MGQGVLYINTLILITSMPSLNIALSIPSSLDRYFRAPRGPVPLLYTGIPFGRADHSEYLYEVALLYLRVDDHDQCMDYRSRAESDG